MRRVPTLVRVESSDASDSRTGGQQRFRGAVSADFSTSSTQYKDLTWCWRESRSLEQPARGVVTDVTMVLRGRQAHFQSMVVVSFLCEYPWSSGTVERQCVAFPLWDGYGHRTPIAAHDFVLRLLAAPGPIEVLDANGEAWSFARGTVRAVWTMDVT